MIEPTNNELWSLREGLVCEQTTLEKFILRTPTSEKRNILTEANLQLCLALKTIERLLPGF